MNRGSSLVMGALPGSSNKSISENVMMHTRMPGRRGHLAGGAGRGSGTTGRSV